MNGTSVRLPGRGTTFARVADGPRGAPTLMLLHGLGATTAVNWPHAFETLSRRFRVVGLDHRGHGRGMRSPWPFQLSDCADDAVALADVLGIDRFVAVGYSMGGPVALLARRRHPERVSGLVLCATSAYFTGDEEGSPSPMMAVVAASLRLTPSLVRRQMAASIARQVGERWGLSPAFVEEARRHDPAAIFEATRAVRRFDARSWVGQLRAPAASVITTRDRFVPPSRQGELARAAGAVVHTIDADHDVPMRRPDRFLAVLADACTAVCGADGRLATA